MRHLICLALLVAACGDGPTAPGTPANLVADSVTRDGIPVSPPAAEGISEANLSTLLGEAQTQQSDAVVIMRNGKLVYETYFGHPIGAITAMSASKSFVSLAFGYLVADGKLSSLDTPVIDIIPAFANSDSRKAGMTIRQLLSQSSGLDPTRAGGSVGDIEATGIAKTTMYPPGTGWQYSNGGIDFLAAIAGHLAGMPMDAYLQQKLFAPMGITSVSWYHDSKGVPLGAGEMSINPLDLAKVGQAMLDHGVWRGKQVIASDWIDSSTAMSQPYQPNYGWLWWRLPTTVYSYGVTSDLLSQWSAMHGAPDSTRS